MSPAPLFVVVAAGLAGAAVLAVPSIPPAPPSARTSTAVAVRPDPGLPAGARVVPAVPGAPQVIPRAPSSVNRFQWPLSPAPAVLRRFAVGPHRWSPGHRGVDLAAGAGQAVLAAGAGTVAFAGVIAGRGVVTVAHPGGLRTTYEPLTAGVRTGDAVSAGGELGVLAAGRHCPTTCLHWGALRGDFYLDPLTLLRPPAPPILLPLGAGAP